MLSLIPHAELVDVAAAGHMVAGDDNDAFAQPLTGFLDRIEPAEPRPGEQGSVLRQPAADVLETSGIGEYVRWLAVERRLHFDDYQALCRWSVDDLEAFWACSSNSSVTRSTTTPAAVTGSSWFTTTAWTM